MKLKQLHPGWQKKSTRTQNMANVLLGLRPQKSPQGFLNRYFITEK